VYIISSFFLIRICIVDSVLYDGILMVLFYLKSDNVLHMLLMHLQYCNGYFERMLHNKGLTGHSEVNFSMCNKDKHHKQIQTYLIN